MALQLQSMKVEVTITVSVDGRLETIWKEGECFVQWLRFDSDIKDLRKSVCLNALYQSISQ